MKKMYKGASYELAEEGFWRIFIGSGWTKIWGSEKACRALIRSIVKENPV